MKALSPGKLIISGEHSVVYGQPALAMAIDRFVETTVSTDISKIISFNLINFSYKDSFTIQTLLELKNRLMDQYKLFVNGEIGIKKVLKTPYELSMFAFINVVDHFNSKVIDGLNIKVNSSIPIGCGMGSSAAVILSILHAVAMYFHIPFDEEKYLSLGYDAEKLQHGFPSGLDPYISLHGGSVYFRQKKKTPFDLPKIQMFMVNTGIPNSTTGECVEAVSKSFSKDLIWNDFGAVTQEICKAFQNKKILEIQKCIKENHRLLVKIGVVPLTVQNFISDIEKQGAAAKICGAGSISSEKGGIVLIIAESPKSIQPICEKYGYKISPIKLEERGLHIV